jgi:hypothetical protein
LTLLRQLVNWLAVCLQDSPTDPSTADPAAAGPQATAAASGGISPGGRTSELARLFDMLVERMRSAAPAGSPADFFASQDGRSTQLEWLALQVGAGTAGPHLGVAVGGRVGGCLHLKQMCQTIIGSPGRLLATMLPLMILLPPSLHTGLECRSGGRRS